jgi:hypothetical protein
MTEYLGAPVAKGLSGMDGESGVIAVGAAFFWRLLA